MTLIKGMGDFFALDIGTNAIRVVQLSRAGNGWNLIACSHVPVDSKISTSDSAEAHRRLGEVIMTAVGQAGVKTKNVVIGLPSNKTFTTIIDVPVVSDVELKATMKYQIDQYIPMSADEAKVDWALLGPSLHAQGQQEVLVTSVAKDYSEERLEFIEGLGFNVVAAEPDPIAMVRALVPPPTNEATLLIDMGELSTDLAITYGDTPRLIRNIPTGVGSFVKAAVQNLGVQEDQARQFIVKFGLEPERLEGQVLRALETSLDGFVAEVTKSIKFFQTRYPNVAVSSILLSGYSAVIPRFGDYFTAKTSIRTAVANPWQNINVPTKDQQSLAAVATEFSVAVGLAERSGF